LSQIIGYAAIYYITPHKTHLKGDFSAFRCTGRVNVQGQTIGTKKGTQSPHFLELHWQGLPPLVCHGIGYALIGGASNLPSVCTGWQVVDSLRFRFWQGVVNMFDVIGIGQGWQVMQP